MIVDVYPAKDFRSHIMGLYCWCFPSVQDEGLDVHGKPARLIIHNRNGGENLN